MIITFVNGIPYDESGDKIDQNNNNAYKMMDRVCKYFDKKFNGKISIGIVDSYYYSFWVQNYYGEYVPIRDRTVCIENNKVIWDKLTLMRC